MNNSNDVRWLTDRSRVRRLLLAAVVGGSLLTPGLAFGEASTADKSKQGKSQQTSRQTSRQASKQTSSGASKQAAPKQAPTRQAKPQASQTRTRAAAPANAKSPAVGPSVRSTNRPAGPSIDTGAARTRGLNRTPSREPTVRTPAAPAQRIDRTPAAPTPRSAPTPAPQPRRGLTPSATSQRIERAPAANPPSIISNRPESPQHSAAPSQPARGGRGLTPAAPAIDRKSGDRQRGSSSIERDEARSNRSAARQSPRVNTPNNAPTPRNHSGGGSTFDRDASPFPSTRTPEPTIDTGLTSSRGLEAATLDRRGGGGSDWRGGDGRGSDGRGRGTKSYHRDGEHRQSGRSGHGGDHDRHGGYNHHDSRRYDHGRYDGHGHNHGHGRGHHDRHHDHDSHWSVGFGWGWSGYDCWPVYRPYSGGSYGWVGTGYHDDDWSFGVSVSIGSSASYLSTTYGYGYASPWRYCGYPSYGYGRYGYRPYSPYRPYWAAPSWCAPAPVWCYDEPWPVYRASSVTVINAGGSSLELYGEDDPFVVLYNGSAAQANPSVVVVDSELSSLSTADLDAAASNLRSAAKADLMTAANALWREDYGYGVRTILSAADRSPRLLAIGMSDLLTERERQDLRLALLRVETPPTRLVHERDAAFAAGVLSAALEDRDNAVRWLRIAQGLGENSPTSRIMIEEMEARGDAPRR